MSEPLAQPDLRLVIVSEAADACEPASTLAASLGLACHVCTTAVEMARAVAASDVAVVWTGERLELRMLTGEATLRGGRPVFADFATLDVTTPAGRSLDQPIARAVGHRKRSQPTRVLDVTAGWCEDAWLLAALGCAVVAVERHPVVHALVQDGLRRAAAHHPEITARLHLRHAQGLDVLRETMAVLPDDIAWRDGPDVVYLDPMFPTGRRTEERKPMRVLRRLAGHDADAATLFDAARQAARRRVVIKRPAHGEPLTATPSFVTKGKGLRYDVYLREDAGVTRPHATRTP